MGKQRFTQLIIVTSSYHMPRSLSELGRVMPNIVLIPYPVVTRRLARRKLVVACGYGEGAIQRVREIPACRCALRGRQADADLGNQALAGNAHMHIFSARLDGDAHARSLLFAVVFYANTAVFLLCGSWLLLAPRRWAMAGLRLHGLASLWWLKVICATHYEVRGRENIPDGACLVASKHQSTWDTFALIPVFRDPAMVMKAELGWIPLYGWFSYKFQHIFVRRDKGPSALKR